MYLVRVHVPIAEEPGAPADKILGVVRWRVRPAEPCVRRMNDWGEQAWLTNHLGNAVRYGTHTARIGAQAWQSMGVSWKTIYDFV